MASDAATALAEAKGFQGLSERELVLAQIALLGRIWGGDMTDVGALLREAACFQCLSELQLQYVLGQLLVNIRDKPGSGCIVCGLSDPVEAPDCDCALAYNRVTSALFYWDSVLVQWIPLIQ